MQSPGVTVVVPVYRNTETLAELHRRLRLVLESGSLRYQIIFVDDACPDGSFVVLEKLAEIDPSVMVLALERNLGQHGAVLVGLRYAEGECVVLMDADLQDPPEAIPELLETLRGGPAAVFAGRRGRYESAFRLFTSRVFKRLLNLLCGVPTDAGMFVAMHRQMVVCLLSFDEPGPSVVAMIGCTGLPLASIPVLRVERPTGRSAFSFRKRLRTACLAIIWVLWWKWASKRGLCRHGVDGTGARAPVARKLVNSDKREVVNR